jgi:hypothetical protein
MGNIVGAPDNSPVAGAAIRGTVHGGQNPIKNATIQLWTVGVGSSYGAAATTLGPPLITGSDGSFAYTAGSYTCPTGTTQTYITSSGGDPGLGTGVNPNIKLVAATGNCSNLASDYIVINEVTTAATALALGQYFTTTFGSSSADSFGSPSTPQALTGMANAMATVNNLVTTSTGNAVTSNTFTTGVGTITATPESAKLYTVADILAACVNSVGGTTGDGSPCGHLFADVVTASGTPPTDTLQAAVYMSLNPTSANSNASFSGPCVNNLCDLFALITAQAPFTAGAQPTDWTVGIQYQGSGNALLLSSPLAIAADFSGNIWVADESTATGFANASLAELSPSGSPLLASNLQVGSGPTLTSNNPRNLAIDTNGNVFVPTSTTSAYLFEYTSTGSVVVSPALSKSTYGIAIDGNNDVFVSEESSSPHFSFFEFVGGVLSADHQVEYANTSPIFQVEQLAIDTSGNLWASPQGSGSLGVLELSNINISSCGAPPFATAPCPLPASSSSANTYTVTTSAGLSAAWGLAASPTGIWAPNSTNSTVVNLTGTAPSITATAYGSTSSLATPGLVAVDGAGNVWVNNKVAGAISEFNGSGTVLSPSGTTIGFVHPGLVGTQNGGITIDPSGNVWAADYATSGPTAFSVFEMVGAAAPTVTPIAQALKNGSVGMKP